jgi:hypothetical protein
LIRLWGHVAEWLRSGLQNRLLRFNSGRGLQLQCLDFIEYCGSYLVSRSMPAAHAELPFSVTGMLGSERNLPPFDSTRVAAVHAPCRPYSRIARPKGCRRYIQSAAMNRRRELDLTPLPAQQGSARPASAIEHNWRTRAQSVGQRQSALHRIREDMPAAVVAN